jgi:hypothetical protein
MSDISTIKYRCLARTHNFLLLFYQPKLLDDGSGRDPLEVHNFGKAAKYLFRPCKNEDGGLDEVSQTVMPMAE